MRRIEERESAAFGLQTPSLATIEAAASIGIVITGNPASNILLTSGAYVYTTNYSLLRIGTILRSTNYTSISLFNPANIR